MQPYGGYRDKVDLGHTPKVNMLDVLSMLDQISGLHSTASLPADNGLAAATCNLKLRRPSCIQTCKVQGQVRVGP